MVASALQHFKEVLRIHGSVQEKERGNRLLSLVQCVDDVEDKTAVLKEFKAITASVFAVGHHYAVPTWTSNKTATRRLRQAGYLLSDLLVYVPSTGSLLGPCPPEPV
jgi:hypothetical protein